MTLEELRDKVEEIRQNAPAADSDEYADYLDSHAVMLTLEEIPVELHEFALSSWAIDESKIKDFFKSCGIVFTDSNFSTITQEVSRLVKYRIYPRKNYATGEEWFSVAIGATEVIAAWEQIESKYVTPETKKSASGAPVFSNVIMPQTHFSVNNRLANVITSPAVVFNELIDYNAGGKKSANIRSCFSINYEGADPAISLSQPVTPFDRSIFDTAISLLLSGNRIFTPAVLHRAMTNMTEANDPSPQQKGAITKSINKMRFENIHIDCKEELERMNATIDGKKVTGGGIDDYMLPLRVVTVNAGGKEMKAYQFIDEPIIYKYALATKQILTIPAECLSIMQVDAKTKKVTANRIKLTDTRIIIRDYLLRRIAVMKGKTKTSNHILLDDMYEKICEPSPTTEKAHDINTFVKLVLAYWAGIGYIKSFKVLKEGRSIRGYEVQY